MVEHSAVNRVVAGSSPARGVKHLVREILLGAYIWPVGQAVKTSPFHGGNTSSILVRVIYIRRDSQVVRPRSATPLSPVQIRLTPLKALEFPKLFFYRFLHEGSIYAKGVLTLDYI